MAVAEKLSAVDLYLDGLEHARKSEIETLRRLIHAAVPGLEERIKWNAPSFGPGADDRLTMRIHPGDRLQLILHRGARAGADDLFRFEDPDRIIGWAAPDRGVDGLDYSAHPSALERLREVADGRLDAVVLARAGLLRLGRAGEATDVIDPALMLPAPGQGALAVECRAGDRRMLALLASLDDRATRVCVTAERAVLATLGAGCAAPLGALAELDGGAGRARLRLRALVAAVDGSAVVPFTRMPCEPCAIWNSTIPA